jgi:hypothetical protein
LLISGTIRLTAWHGLLQVLGFQDVSFPWLLKASTWAASLKCCLATVVLYQRAAPSFFPFPIPSSQFPLPVPSCHISPYLKSDPIPSSHSQFSVATVVLVERATPFLFHVGFRKPRQLETCWSWKAVLISEDHVKFERPRQ